MSTLMSSSCFSDDDDFVDAVEDPEYSSRPEPDPEPRPKTPLDKLNDLHEQVREQTMKPGSHRSIVSAASVGSCVLVCWALRNDERTKKAVLCCDSGKIKMGGVINASCREGFVATDGFERAVFTDVAPGVHVVCLCDNKDMIIAKSSPVTVGQALSYVSCQVVDFEQTEKDSIAAVEYVITSNVDGVKRGDPEAIATERAAYQNLVSRRAYFGLYTEDLSLSVREELRNWPMNRVHLRLPFKAGTYQCRLVVEVAAAAAAGSPTTADFESPETKVAMTAAKACPDLPHCQICGTAEVKDENGLYYRYSQNPYGDMTESCVGFSSEARVEWVYRGDMNNPIIVLAGEMPDDPDFVQPAVPGVPPRTSRRGRPLVPLVVKNANDCCLSSVSGVVYFNLTDFPGGDYEFWFFAKGECVPSLTITNFEHVQQTKRVR